MRLYTKNGDSGYTRIRGGQRLAKCNILIDANGDIDELNTIIGIARHHAGSTEIGSRLLEIQRELMVIMSRVATPEAIRHTNGHTLAPDAVERLERWIDAIDVEGRFVVPGGCLLAAYLHHARAVCRRAERKLWQLNSIVPQEANVMSYINRLSDWLFAISCKANSLSGERDETWKYFGQ